MLEGLTPLHVCITLSTLIIRHSGKGIQQIARMLQPVKPLLCQPPPQRWAGQSMAMQPFDQLRPRHQRSSSPGTTKQHRCQRQGPRIQLPKSCLGRHGIQHLKEVASRQRTGGALREGTAVGIHGTIGIVKPPQGVTVFVGNPKAARGVRQNRREHPCTGLISALHEQGIAEGISDIQVLLAQQLAQLQQHALCSWPVGRLDIAQSPLIMLVNRCRMHALAQPLLECSLEAAIQWPAAAALAELEGTDLLHLWLQRRIEQELARLAPLDALIHHWFGTAATSLFLQRRAGLDRCAFSILRLRDAELAQELFFRLQAGEADFPQLAHYSEGQEGQLGARLGPLPLSQLHPLVAEQLRRSQPAEVLPPLELDDGQILVLRLDLLMPACQNEAMQTQLEQELFCDWLEQEQQRLLACDPKPGSRLSLRLPGLLP